MTQQEIQERNIEICKMIGATPCKDWQGKDGFEHSSWFHFQWSNRFQDNLELYSYSYSELKFHSDYNWLMEAVEFIENIRDEQGYGNMVNIWVTGCNVCENNAGYKIIENIFAPTKKEAIFIAVSDFAKLHNNKKLK